MLLKYSYLYSYIFFADGMMTLQSMAFAINSKSGAITVNDAGDLNYEGTKTFSLTVQASDGSLSSTATATINLTNVDEDPSGSVLIQGTAIQGNKLTVVSTLKDPDGDGTASYQWLRNDVAIANANASTCPSAHACSYLA
jgi:hypothetical protein